MTEDKNIENIVDGRVKDTLIPFLELKIIKTINGKMYIILVLFIGAISALFIHLYLNAQRTTAIETNNDNITAIVKQSVIDNKSENDKLREEIKESNKENSQEVKGIRKDIKEMDRSYAERFNVFSGNQSIVFYELRKLDPGFDPNLMNGSGL